MAVLAEHMGHGGSAAAPPAKDVIEAYVKAYPQMLQEFRRAGEPSHLLDRLMRGRTCDD